MSMQKDKLIPCFELCGFLWIRTDMSVMGVLICEEGKSKKTSERGVEFMQ